MADFAANQAAYRQRISDLLALVRRGYKLRWERTRGEKWPDGNEPALTALISYGVWLVRREELEDAQDRCYPATEHHGRCLFCGVAKEEPGGL